jgi:hypothetical protein
MVCAVSIGERFDARGEIDANDAVPTLQSA